MMTPLRKRDLVVSVAAALFVMILVECIVGTILQLIADYRDQGLCRDAGYDRMADLGDVRFCFGFQDGTLVVTDIETIRTQER